MKTIIYEGFKYILFDTETADAIAESSLFSSEHAEYIFFERLYKTKDTKHYFLEKRVNERYSEEIPFTISKRVIIPFAGLDAKRWLIEKGKTNEFIKEFGDEIEK